MSEIKENYIARLNLRKAFSEIYDLERLAGRVALKLSTPRDLVALKTSLAGIPKIKSMLDDFTAPLLRDLREGLQEMPNVVDLIGRAITENPPPRTQEGGFIAAGYDEELDKLRSISRDGKKWIAALENTERQKTGINSLKVGFNNIFGYYIEVTKANAHLVPESYIRKQTLVNAERYINQELKEFEQTVLNAEEKINQREQELFVSLREKSVSI